MSDWIRNQHAGSVDALGEHGPDFEVATRSTEQWPGSFSGKEIRGAGPVRR